MNRTTQPTSARTRRCIGTSVVAALSLMGLWAPVRAADPHSGHQVDVMQTRSEQIIALPAVAIQRNDGKHMTLVQALDDGRPVMLNFIYTSCTAICPVTSQVFVEFRERIGATRDKINMVSISIDPEQDTPRRLTEYATRFGSAGTWAHYTSSTTGSVDIQRAFAVWRGDKMNHQPTTFLRAAPGKPWVRLDGFVGPTALVDEYRKTISPGPKTAAVSPARQALQAIQPTPAPMPASL